MEKKGNNLVVCYYRLSTDKQALGVDAQKATIKQYLSEHPELIVIGEYEDAGETATSGKKASRPGFNEAMTKCENSGATLLAATMDRIGRGKFLYKLLGDDKVRFRALDMKGESELEMSIRIALAIEEVNKISERTRKGKLAKHEILAKARESYEKGDMESAQRFIDYAQRTSRKVYSLEEYAERGFRDNGATGPTTEEGRRKIATARNEEAETDDANLKASIAIRRYLKEGGKRTFRAIADHLNHKQLRTRRGQVWTKETPELGWKPQSVKNLMERFEI